jgi:20S proteasome alpha/beta subunit
MTICLGALCAKGGASSADVVAADRMVTMGAMTEFEHAVPKMTMVADGAVALMAGDALAGSGLISDLASSMTGGLTLHQLADMLAEKYVVRRLAHVQADVLTPRGLTLQSFYENQTKLVAQLAGMIDQQLTGYNLGVEILLAGVDQSGGHLHSVHNPGGRQLQHDLIGHAAIGSGAIHAVQSMIGFGHTGAAELKETVFRVYASKKRAEAAPGVGQDTDMMVITEGATHQLSAEVLQELEEAYLEFVGSIAKGLGGKLKKLDFLEEGPKS